MALIEHNLFGETHDKVKMAIERMRAFEPPEGYYLAFSGGKDSVALLRIAEMAGVKFDAHYNVTTVDPPEAVRFIRDVHPGVVWERPKKSMRRLIIEFGVPPMPKARYCCKILKESNGDGRIVATGVRWAESTRRKTNQGTITIINGGKTKATSKKVATDNGAAYQLTPKGGLVLNFDDAATRRTGEQCYRTHRTLVNPIIDWTDDDVWEFIRAESIPYCGLYDEGVKRIGCVGCPMGGNKSMQEDFERWPGYRRMYVNAFDEMLKERERRGLGNRTGWTDGESVMRWWTMDKIHREKGQMRFDELEEG